jgi:hypothetical protein
MMVRVEISTILCGWSKKVCWKAVLTYLFLLVRYHILVNESTTLQKTSEQKRVLLLKKQGDHLIPRREGIAT